MRNGVIIKLYWDTYLNNTESWARVKQIATEGYDKTDAVSDSRELNKDPTYKPKVYLYATTGLWFALNEPRDQIRSGFKKSLDEFVEIMANRVDYSFEKVYYAPAQLPLYELLDDFRRPLINQEAMAQIHKYTDKAFGYVRDKNGKGFARDGVSKYPGGIFKRGSTTELAINYMPVFNEISGHNHLGILDRLGLHYINDALFLQMDIMLNHFCNARAFANETAQARHNIPHTGTCCTPYENNFGTMMWAYIATASLFGAGLLAAAGAAGAVSTKLGSQSQKHSFVSKVKQTGAALFVVTGACAYCYYADRTHHVNKLAMQFSLFEFGTLVQLWLVGSAFTLAWSTVPGRAAAADGNSRRLGLPLLREWKGLCVSFILIINITGVNRLKTHFEGELVAQILLTSWFAAEICEFVHHYYTRKSGNESAAGLYVFKAGRALVLPVLLSCALDTPQPLFSVGQYHIATKLAFWLSFAFFALVGLEATDFVDNYTLETLGVPFASGNESLKLKLQAWRLLMAGIIVRIVLVLEQPTFMARVSAVHQNVSQEVLPDYWVLLGAFIFAWYTNNSTESYREVSRRPGAWNWRHLVAAIAVLFAVSYIVFSGNFTYFFPRPDTFPMSSVQMHSYDEVIAQWGANYSNLKHTVMCLLLVPSYLVLRLAVLNAFKLSATQEHCYRYVRSFVYVAGIGYELLILRYHIFLAGDLTTRLHFLPTGVIRSLMNLKTQGLLPKDAPDNFVAVALVEAARKVLNFVLVGAVFVATAHVLARTQWAALLGGDVIGAVSDASNGFVDAAGGVEKSKSEEKELEECVPLERV